MKKILSIISFCAIGASATAQIQDLRIGPEVGVNFVTLGQKINGESRETNYQLGFKAGATVDIQFTNNFYLQPAIFLSVNNGSESYYQRNYRTGGGVPYAEKDRRQYQVTQLQVPVYAMYKTDKEFDDPHFFFGIGPSFNLGISGQYSQEYSLGQNGVDRPTRTNTNIRFGNHRTLDHIRRFDLAANATVGYQMPMGLFFRAFYGIGLLNMAPDGDKNNYFRNSGGGLSVGFLFKTFRRNHWE